MVTAVGGLTIAKTVGMVVLSHNFTGETPLSIAMVGVDEGHRAVGLSADFPELFFDKLKAGMKTTLGVDGKDGLLPSLKVLVLLKQQQVIDHDAIGTRQIAGRIGAGSNG